MFISERVYITEIFARDPECKAHVHKYLAEINHVLEKIIGSFGVELDGRFESVRT